MTEQKFRVGIGYDIHKLAENRELVIGGIKIPYEKGLLGHSDADVLVHAIIDALLGALALDDIGTLFPDTDDRFKNADSIELLKKVIISFIADISSYLSLVSCEPIPITTICASL